MKDRRTSGDTAPWSTAEFTFAFAVAGLIIASVVVPPGWPFWVRVAVAILAFPATVAVVARLAPILIATTRFLAGWPLKPLQEEDLTSEEQLEGVELEPTAWNIVAVELDGHLTVLESFPPLSDADPALVLQDARQRVTRPVRSLRLVHGTSEIAAWHPPLWRRLSLVWRLRDTVHRRTHRLGAIIAGIAALGAGFIIVFAVVLPSESPFQIEELVWPGNEASKFIYVANISDRSLLSRTVSASANDELLVRIRLAPGRAPASFRLRTLLRAARAHSSSVFVSSANQTVGKSLKTSFDEVAVKVPPELRLRAVPGSTMLRNAAGEVVRVLPDALSRPRGLLVERPSLGGHFIDTQIRVSRATSADKGQIAEATFSCRDTTQFARSQPVRVFNGSVVLCRVPLRNWGPRTLPSVTLRLNVSQARTTNDLNLVVLARSREASPLTTRLTARLERAYSPKQSLLFISGRVLSQDGLPGAVWQDDPLIEDVNVGLLSPGKDGSLIAVMKFVVGPSTGWRPDRPITVWPKPAPYLTFNAIIGTPHYGDERAFYKVSTVAKGGWTAALDNLWVHEGDKLKLEVFYENSAAYRPAQVARNTRSRCRCRQWQ